jgi:uridylate kinase
MAMTTPSPLYRRVLLKLSGEALMGSGAFGWHLPTVQRIADEIGAVCQLGVEVGVVVGGGNLFRGQSSVGAELDRVDADHMGMLATVMNAIALQNVLSAAGLPAVALSAIPMPTVCESFNRRNAVRHLTEGRVVIFGGGTGNPFFTTDSAAALRAVEMGCELLCKGTQVDGIYSADPKKDASATRYDSLSFDQVLAQNLKVMDGAAVAIARDNALPIAVFSLGDAGGFGDVVRGRGRFTLVR